MKQVSYSLVICVFLLAGTNALGQPNYQQYYLKRKNFEVDLPDLRREFGYRKIIPPELELECLTALSFYPELRNVSIEFRFGKLNFTMISKPKFRSILHRGEEREYVIVVQRPGLSKNNLEWTELSFNALVGWIGHELGHIMHYSHKSNGGVLFTGIKYAFPGYRRKMERFTDQIAIQHDLGYALYEGVDYTLNYSCASAHYRKSQNKFYLGLDEIIERVHSKDLWSAMFRRTRMRYEPNTLQH